MSTHVRSSFDLFSAARTTLVIQNLGVLVCATCIFFVITFKPQIVAYWPDQGLLILCYAGIILIAVISNLASMGTKIALQRDWIVEICGRDKDALACKLLFLKDQTDCYYVMTQNYHQHIPKFCLCTILHLCYSFYVLLFIKMIFNIWTSFLNPLFTKNVITLVIPVF